MTEKRPIDVSYRPTLQDVLHAARLAEGETWKTSSRIAAILLVATAAWLFYWQLGAWALVFLGLGVAEWFNLLPLSLVAVYVQYRRDPKYQQEYHLTLSEEHLRFRTATLDSTLKWEHYNRFWETSRAFVLAYGAGIPTVIPKNAFATRGDLDAARELLAGAVAQRTRRKGRAAEQGVEADEP